MIERVARAVAGRFRRRLLRECRRCGTAVDRSECCPECGSREIASYDL